MIRDVGEPAIAFRLVAAEIGETFIIDAQHFAGRRVIVEAAGGAENAVQHLRLDPVALLVLEPQVRIGQPPSLFLLRVIEARRGHPVGAVDLARLIHPPGRAPAAIDPERGAVLRDPFAAARPFGHIGHAVLELGGGVGGEQVGRQPDQVDMAIGRNDVVFHAQPLVMRLS